VTLKWYKLPGGAEMACGDGWTYLITRNDSFVVLTRWDTGPNPAAHEIASQAALYAIRLGGPYGESPDTAEVTAVHLMRVAQAYESGLDVTAERAWRH
jgi:hypothetical protein